MKFLTAKCLDSGADKLGHEPEDHARNANFLSIVKAFILALNLSENTLNFIRNVALLASVLDSETEPVAKKLVAHFN